MRGVFRGPAERARLIATFRESGLSGQAFAEVEGIPPSTFYQWLKRDKAPAPTVRVARVVRPSPVSFGTRAQGPAAAIVIELGAARVHVTAGSDRTTLTAVLDILEGRRQKDAP